MRLLRAEWGRLFARRFTRWMLVLLVVALAGLMAVVVTSGDTSGFAFWRDTPELIAWYSVVAALFAYPVAASFVGAEWTTGGVATLLTWRPRRGAVFAGKLVALITAITAVYVVVGAAWVAGCWLLAAQRGGPGHGSRQLAESLAASGARGLGLALFAAVAGFALASLGRRTVAAFGVAAAYVVAEIGVPTVLRRWDVATPDRYLLRSYLDTWLTTPYGADWLTAAGVLGAVVAALLVVAAAAFQRRDVG